jgi:hypothetical protein
MLSEAPAPAVVTKTQTVTVCPAELSAEPIAPPKVPDGAVINGNDQGQGWVSALYAYASGLYHTFSDAHSACQPQQEPPK